MKSRKFDSKFFTDPYIQNLKLDEKLVYIYYLFNGEVNWIGCYEMSDQRVVFEVGYELTTDRLQEIKNKFQEDNKILFLNHYVILKNSEKHENHLNNIQLMRSAYKQYLELPNVIIQAFRDYKEPEMIQKYDEIFSSLQCSLQCSLRVGEGEREGEREYIKRIYKDKDKDKENTKKLEEVKTLLTKKLSI